MREGRFLVLHEADWLMKSLGQDDRFLGFTETAFTRWLACVFNIGSLCN